MDAVTYKESANRVVTEVIAPSAANVDRQAQFPHRNLDALAMAGLLGLISAKEAGGIGEGMRAAALVIE